MTATPTPSRVHLTLALIKAALGIGGLLLVVVLIVMIYSDASVSTEPGIASNAQAMLAAATSDDDASYIMAASAFVDACNKLIP